jgi:hypothetical protein
VCKFESKTIKIRCCKNRDCSEYKVDVENSFWQYCPICSAPLHDMNTDIDSTISQDDIIANIDNHLVKPLCNVRNIKYVKYVEATRSHIYIPNPNSSVPHIFYDSSEDTNITFRHEFNFGNVSHIVRTFKSFYSLSLQNLFDAYGKKNVNVDFGLLTQIMD